MSLKHTLIHLFLPHHTNNHRPKILHIDVLSLYIIFFLVFNISIRFIHNHAPDILGYATDIYIDQLLAATNSQRTSEGLAPLTINPQLSQAAAAKAQNMISENYWAHNSPGGRTPWYFINASGYSYTIAGENLAKNFMNSQSVVDAWMASPSHRDNIMKTGYRDVGFAVVNGVINGEETTLVVQMFGASNSTLAQKPAVPVAEGRSVVALIPTQPPAGSLAIPNRQPTATVNQSAIGTRATPKPTNLPQNVAGTTGNPSSGGNEIDNAYNGVSIKPLIDISIFSKEMMYTFIFIIMTVLVIDALIVTRKRIVRVTGHNMAHFMLFAALLIITAYSYSGSIL
jgi:hypothetical protein